MPFDTIPQALLQTIISQIALLLFRGTGGDQNAAQKAALQILLSYAPETEAELHLAARIIAFGLQAVEALVQAADPEIPLLRVLRLRSGAVNLSREAQKAESQLAKLREARRQNQPEEPIAPEPKRVEKTVALVEDTRKVAAYAKAHGLTWTKAYDQRQRDKRLAERQRKQQNQCPAGTAGTPALA